MRQGHIRYLYRWLQNSRQQIIRKRKDFEVEVVKTMKDFL